ncbi:hypothetical protein CDAR_2651 [Caerostris darwini]|uniref:Endonuclease/exonuclease/phosphatase domain-containing protein n=1 Tax=Caerostris darwini TaxID=1538125 RepID=A0AAV4MYS3_9ARAC|nr:hypothetical protein CDAR_2651 [Caerostris darwini]
MASKFVPLSFHGGHLNLGNARAAMAFLNNAISTYDFDFFSINEPYTFDDNITSIPWNYSIASHNRAPKAAIILKSSHNSQIIHTSKEIVVIMARINGISLLLISVYCPPSKNIDYNLNILRTILDKYHDLPTVILGDFNAKSRVWGRRNLDDRGKQTVDLLSSAGVEH